MRKFNTEGPVVAADHYRIPPLERIDLGRVLDLIRDKRYFVLHAPRRTGKTSALLALRDLLNGGSEGGFRCVYVNVEAAQAAREDVGRAMQVVIECKVARGSLERTIAEGLEQTAAYMDRCAAGEGHLVVVDRDAGKRWEEKVFRRRLTSRAGAATGLSCFVMISRSLRYRTFPIRSASSFRTAATVSTVTFP